MRPEKSPSSSGGKFQPRPAHDPARGAVDVGDIYDSLTLKLHQVEAMLRMTHGSSAAGFRQLGEASQDDYMSACVDALCSCEALALELGPAIYGRRHV